MENESGFLLLKPKIPADSGKIARAIMMCEGVKEVFLTSGEYAFVVSVKSNLKGIKKSIRRIAKSVRVSEVIGHHSYKN